MRVLVVGVHGHGRVHLENIRRHAGTLRLVGVCDRRPLTPELRDLAGDVPEGPSLPEMLASTRPDITVIATPIHTHVDLALAAAEAGSHLLLEKPPAPTLAEFDRLAAGLRRHGRVCQVGFQSLGSEALPAVRDMIADGEIGEVTGIGATGLWARGPAYYARAPWAGRRTIDGVPVMDGALTNPFAHAVITALMLAGNDAARVEADLYHANDIEADDTASLRLTTSGGTTALVAVTLCAERPRDPCVVVSGTHGRISLAYTRDEVRVNDGPPVVHRRADLLANLVAHLRGQAALLAPLVATRAFTAVVEAIGSGPAPRAIPAGAWRTGHDEGGARRVVTGIDGVVTAAATGRRLFRELDLPWTAS